MNEIAGYSTTQHYTIANRSTALSHYTHCSFVNIKISSQLGPYSNGIGSQKDFSYYNTNCIIPQETQRSLVRLCSVGDIN